MSDPALNGGPPLSAIPGVAMSGTAGFEPPIVLVIGPEKVGKSSLAISLIGWPGPGEWPLVIAWDPSGPDSCSGLGYPVPVLKIKDQPGLTYWDKASAALASIEHVYKSGKRPYSSIVVDCASVMADKLYEDARKQIKTRNKLQHYGMLLEQSREFMSRLTDLGVPTIWLAWQRDSFIEENEAPGGQKSRRTVLGGPQITGSFKALLAGKAHQIVVVEKVKVAPNAPGADSRGYQRLLHTQTWNAIEAGGRYVLPEPFPPHLGMLLDAIMRRGQFAPQGVK